MDCKTRLEQYFRDNGVDFATLTHPAAYTAQQVAEAQGVPGKQVAKVVMVVAEGKIAMLVVPASHRVDFAQLGSVLSASGARLAKEGEFVGLFPDCETGAMPPLGNLYGVPVYVDRTLREGGEIVFAAGTHRDTIKMAYEDLARLAKPVVGDFAVQP